MSWVVFVVVVVVLVGLAWWLVFGVSDVERRLRVVCSGDKALVARLINYELRRVPGISRREAAVRALESYRRDNR